MLIQGAIRTSQRSTWGSLWGRPLVALIGVGDFRLDAVRR
jgi:hypothetical protein